MPGGLANSFLGDRSMKIGLTHTGLEEKHQNYIKWLTGNDEIEIIQLSEKDNNPDTIKNYDALILSGGVDIHPKFYKNQKINYSHSPNKFNEQRDEFEIALFRLAQETNKPVLGICRGFQLINCIYSGNLKQDIGDEQNKIHKAEIINHIQKDKAHGLDIEKGTTLHEIVKNSRLVVNSAHHQTIDKVGEGLKVNCQSDDGLAEGFEREHPNGKPFLLAVQWHPERMYKFNLENSPVSKAIRDRFIEEVKKSMTKK
jgi:putative glutamine amidotransferase